MQGFNLSPYQKRDWIFNRSASSLHSHLIIETGGQLSQERLLQVWQQLVARHEILRTHFHSMSSLLYPVQMIKEESPLKVAFKDLQDVTDSRLIDDEIGKITSEPIDLRHESYEALHLLRLEAGRHIFIIKLPAIMTDATSLKNLYNEFMALYTSEKGAPDEEPLQFAQFAEWQNDLLSDVDEDSEAFWKSQNYKGLCN